METPQTIEAVGSDLEDAVTRGLEALNAARSEVDVLVLETNPRATRVRLTIKGTHSQPITPEDIQTAERVVTELLNKMQLSASLSTQTAAALDTQDEQRGPTIAIDVRGEDLGSLIGRKGETLDNLQYITRLLVAKAVGRYVNIVIDVEGYKSHRAEILKQLALNLAERVVSSRKPMSLEPMPANERRIIHLALRDHPQVRTESAGFEDRRKVTIFPKSMKR